MVTVFTPVYNRSYIIDQLYESLKKQTDTDFEWIIIDDGSTDDLREKVEEWLKHDNPFRLYYQYFANGGKHRAINRAVHMAKGEAFFVVDSDDYVSEDAVEFIGEKFKEIADNDKIAAISGLKAYYNGVVIGGMPQIKEAVDAFVFEAGKYGLGGDKAEVYKTNLLRKYPFSEYEGENFLQEGTVWNRIALDGYKIRYYNKVIYYAEYRADGLSRNSYENLINSPRGWAESLRVRKKYKDPQVYKELIHYCYLHLKSGKERICELLDISNVECEQYIQMNMEFDKRLRLLLCGEKISSAALYGCGMYAHYFLNHLRNIDREISYGIDRSVKMIEGKTVYSLAEDIPYVDVIFITPGNLSEKATEEIREGIQDKLPNVKIWTLRELNDRLW